MGDLFEVFAELERLQLMYHQQVSNLIEVCRSGTDEEFKLYLTNFRILLQAQLNYIEEKKKEFSVNETKAKKE